MIPKGSSESEAATRVKRIDPRLTAEGWVIVDHQPTASLSSYVRHGVREYPTTKGPADYALFVRGRLVGIVEAKKFAVGAQNVLNRPSGTRAGRRAPGGISAATMCPFSTSGKYREGITLAPADRSSW